jgi:hypothetical protein
MQPGQCNLKLLRSTAVAKLEIRDLSKKLAISRAGRVVKKTVAGADGKRLKVLTIDANSATFSSDLTKVFKSSVAKARRENKKRFGSPDRILKKA